MKVLLVLLLAGSLSACATDRNKITISTLDGQQVKMADTAFPSTVKEGLLKAKTNQTSSASIPASRNDSSAE